MKKLEPSRTEDSGKTVVRAEGEPKKNQDADLPAPDARIEQATRASELRYRRLFETARDGILILNANTGRIDDVNSFLTDLLGFSRSEMIGKTVGEISPSQDIESNKIMFERLKKDGFVRYDDLPLEAKDGCKIAVEFVCNVYQAGNHSVIQCNVRDITERKRGEEKFAFSTHSWSNGSSNARRNCKTPVPSNGLVLIFSQNFRQTQTSSVAEVRSSC